MTKTLKDLFEVYRPKSPDEQKFVDKHVTIKHKDRNGNGDDVFNASNVKTIKRKEENHGYDSGDDEKVYEEVDLDESVAKVANHLIKRYGDNVRKSHVRSAANDFGVGFVALSHHVRKKLGVNRLEEESIEEKKLTPAEMKKREEVAKAIERENPKMPMAKKMAIATATAKKVAEEVVDEAVGDYTVKTVSAADSWKKHTGPKTSKSTVPTDPKSGKTLFQKVVGEEAEELDEISVKKLTDYTDAASDARGHRNLPTAKLDKRYAGVALAHEKIRARHAKVPATNEEVEQVDEISKETMGRYINKAKDSIDTNSWRQGHREGSKMNPSGRFEKKLSKRHKGIETAVKKLTREEAEQIDELSNKTLGSYVSKAARSAGSNVAGAVATAMANGNKEDQRTMGRKYAQRLMGVDRAVKKMTKEQVIDNAINKFLPELEDYTPMAQEEKLVAKLDGLSEAHTLTLLSLFESLNEDNRTKMLMMIDTREGINSLLDFALQNNRGE